MTNKEATAVSQKTGSEKIFSGDTWVCALPSMTTQVPLLSYCSAPSATLSDLPLLPCPLLTQHFPTLNLRYTHLHSNIPPSYVAPKMAHINKTGKMILMLFGILAHLQSYFSPFSLSGLWADCNLYHPWTQNWMSLVLHRLGLLLLNWPSMSTGVIC